MRPFIELSSFSIGLRWCVAQLHTEMPRLFGTIRALLASAHSAAASDRLSLYPEHNKIRSRPDESKDRKMILALSDSFRKLLSLQVLAWSIRVQCKSLNKRRIKKKRSRRFHFSSNTLP